MTWHIQPKKNKKICDSVNLLQLQGLTAGSVQLLTVQNFERLVEKVERLINVEAKRKTLTSEFEKHCSCHLLDVIFEEFQSHTGILVPRSWARRRDVILGARSQLLDTKSIYTKHLHSASKISRVDSIDLKWSRMTLLKSYSWESLTSNMLAVKVSQSDSTFLRFRNIRELDSFTNDSRNWLKKYEDPKRSFLWFQISIASKKQIAVFNTSDMWNRGSQKSWNKRCNKWHHKSLWNSIKLSRITQLS